jgi:hypothetical protein
MTSFKKQFTTVHQSTLTLVTTLELPTRSKVKIIRIYP